MPKAPAKEGTTPLILAGHVRLGQPGCGRPYPERNYCRHVARCRVARHSVPDPENLLLVGIITGKPA